jgi:energy-coupling factor transporter ATP-binding protein EcfA2
VSEKGDDKRPQADLLFDLAVELYHIGRSEDRVPFIRPKTGPRIAYSVTDGALKRRLVTEFRKRTGRLPNTTAVSDALQAVEGAADEADIEPVHIRVGQVDDTVLLDLGRRDGEAVAIGPGGWDVHGQAPVTFRRTAMTAPMTPPARGGSLADLRALINVSDGSWPLLVGWLISAMMPTRPTPILMIGGQQGSGKSTAARMVGGVLDPQDGAREAPVAQGLPRSVGDWVVAASASWVVLLDNLSNISPWFSDVLCKGVTGDSFARRRLYSDSDIVLTTLRRPVILTSIDAGLLRGDLGSRLLLVDLEPIPATARLTEAELWREFDDVVAGARGALFDLVAAVLKRLPNTRHNGLERMADFDLLLHAIDEEIGLGAVAAYRGVGEAIAEQVIASDAVATAVVELMDGRTEWEGTATDLLHQLTPESRPPKGWPTVPQALTGRLQRAAPALRERGIVLDRERRHDGRSIRLTRVPA